MLGKRLRDSGGRCCGRVGCGPACATVCVWPDVLPVYWLPGIAINSVCSGRACLETRDHGAIVKAAPGFCLATVHIKIQLAVTCPEPRLLFNHDEMGAGCETTIADGNGAVIGRGYSGAMSGAARCAGGLCLSGRGEHAHPPGADPCRRQNPHHFASP